MTGLLLYRWLSVMYRSAIGQSETESSSFEETRKQAKDKTTLWNKTKSMKIKTRQIKYLDYLRRIRWNRSITVWRANVISAAHKNTNDKLHLSNKRTCLYSSADVSYQIWDWIIYSQSVKYEQHSPDSSQFGQQL